MEILETIALLTMETNNSYEQIMRMPYIVMLGLVKHVRLKYLMQNEEWRKAYQKHLTLEALRQGRIKKQTAPDLSAAMALAGGEEWQP